MKKNVLLILALFHLISVCGQVKEWEHWSQKFTSDKNYANPYSDVTIKAEFTGPGNTKYKVYGYWTGGQNYEINFCYPVQGIWKWKLFCSDIENKGLHNISGIVNVKKYGGSNKLYQNGFLKVSNNRRFLVYNNNDPFLWMGDTAWNGPIASTMKEWKKYIDDRAKKHFSVIQITPFHKWAQKTRMKNNPGDLDSEVQKNVKGQVPFTQYFNKINPAYWIDIAKKIQYANTKGLVVVLVGIPGWQFFFKDVYQQITFTRYLTGLLAGNFVIYSPSSDRPYSPASDTMAIVIDSIDSRHLITQHPGTPSGKPVNTAAEAYHDKTYLDFSMCQSGHNGGKRDRCVWNAIHWNLSLYNREPHKPVVNGEAFYHGNIKGSEEKYRGTDIDARSLGWYSWLSGARGYTYGALGLWNWGLTSGGVFVPWKDALKLNSSYQMKYMVEFLKKINWWELEPYPQGVLNQPQDTLKQVAFAKNRNGTLAVAYIPANSSAEIDMKQLASLVNVEWFNPRENRYLPVKDKFDGQSVFRFKAPSEIEKDWVLLFKHEQL